MNAPASLFIKKKGAARNGSGSTSGSIDFVYSFFLSLEDEGQNNTHDNRQIERQESHIKVDTGTSEASLYT